MTVENLDIERTALGRSAVMLTNMVALVTGGGGGIGRGIAIALAEFGANVAILDINQDAAETVAGLIRDKGQRAMVLPVDVRDRDGVRAAVNQVVETLGRLDILVNNAGGTRPIPLIDMTDAQADRQIDLNLRSLVTATQAAARAMIAGGRGGSIINVASIEGMRAAPPYSVYAACKAGMLNFTRTIALELSEHGIRVNAIAPDIVMTKALASFMPDTDLPERLASHGRYVPLGRVGNLDDCAGVAVFLASALSGYVTGTTINVDGGTWASSGWVRDGKGGWSLNN